MDVLHNLVKRSRWSRVTGLAALLCGSAGLVAGCVQVNAPDHPIEITLNINIRQEVVYRLDSTAKELIEQNVEIF